MACEGVYIDIVNCEKIGHRFKLVDISKKMDIKIIKQLTKKDYFA